MKLPDHLLVQFLIWHIRKLRTVKQWSSLHACVWSVASAAAAAKSLQLCLTLCDAIDSSPPGFSVPGILQARTLEWVAISFSNACMHAKSLQSCPILCDPIDFSPPGSSVHGIRQARILERVAMPSSRGSSCVASWLFTSELGERRGKPQWSSLPKINLPRRSGGVKTTNKILPRALSTTQFRTSRYTRG